MKKITGLSFMLICATCLYSQVTLNFCASVASGGHCEFINTRFISSPDSTEQKIIIEVANATGPIGATNVFYKIYRIGDGQDEKFQTMLSQPIQPDWWYAWMPYTFNTPGKFDVKVYNESDQLICSKVFELIPFK